MISLDLLGSLCSLRKSDCFGRESYDNTIAIAIAMTIGAHVIARARVLDKPCSTCPKQSGDDM